MAFTFKKDEVKTLADLKERDEELYSSLVTEAKSGSDELIRELQAKIAKTENSAKIQKFAEKLGLQDMATKLIDEDTPYNEACEALLDAYEPDGGEEEFLESASAPIGVGSDSEESDDSPQSFHDAILFISERDGISKGEAAEKAKVEFAELLTKTVSS